MEESDRGAVIAGTVAGGTLALMHAALWGALNDKPRPLAYVCGVGVLLLAYSGWARAAGFGPVIRGLWIITILAGSGDLTAYAVRTHKDRDAVRALTTLLEG